MRRKLRHVLVLLIIMLDKLNTPAAGQSWLVSDKPQSISSNASSPLSAFPLVLIGSMFGVVPGSILIVTLLLTAWYKRRTKRGLNHNAVGTIIDVGHSKIGQDQSHANNQSLKVGNLSRDEIQTDEVESNTRYVGGPTYVNGHNQTEQGQYQAITESNANTISTVVTSDHNQTGQGQYQPITESNQDTTAAEVTSDHIPTEQGQTQAMTESNANTTTAVVTSDHIPTGQGQYPNIAKSLDAGNKLYGTESTASQVNSPYENQYDLTGQDQYINETITNDLDALNICITLQRLQLLSRS
ncbi:corticospinal neuron axon guidance through spinal cord [Branchiostoma belcheri]|nr:corticospinal neuron axon guidance through spinal cord [Branchiostoma belcheri]